MNLLWFLERQLNRESMAPLQHLRTRGPEVIAEGLVSSAQVLVEKPLSYSDVSSIRAQPDDEFALFLADF